MARLTKAQKRIRSQVRSFVADAKFGGHSKEKVEELLSQADALNRQLPQTRAV